MKKTKLAWLVVIILVTSLFLTACGSGGTQGSSSGSSGNDKVIKIGVILPLSGANALTGQDNFKGIELALKKYTDAGKLPAKIELIKMDDRSTPSEGVAAAQKLVNNEKVSAILGPFNTPVALAVKDVTSKAGVPMLTTGSAADVLTEKDTKYVFRAHMYNALQSKQFAKYIGKDVGIKKVAFLFENTDWGKGLDTSMTKLLEGYGSTVLLHEGFNPGTVDFMAPLTKMQKANPDGIVVIAMTTEAAIIAKQARDLGISGEKIIGLGGWDDKNMPKLATGAEEGIRFIQWFSPEKRPAAKEFNDAYQAAYGVPASSFGAQGYTPAIVLFDAIIRAGSGDREAITNEIAKTKDLAAPIGVITFDERHEAVTDIFMNEWKNGQKVLSKIQPSMPE